MNTGSLRFEALSHLASMGPTPEPDIVAAIRQMAAGKGMSVAGHSHYAILRFLKEAGFVKVKVWLTPEGLEELRRQGWTPPVGEAE